MNNSSKTLVLIVAGATTLAATLGVTLGTIASRVGTQDAAGTPQHNQLSLYRKHNNQW
ncbi:hypothetical protein [Argonema galeatum]|uniref:hypothetical protein n=1 Tax=Argonema galeatum TaxID=2942762 RepID=UPI0020129C65|nr:hypothetical protein [Argonema galeatum]MCL1467408.1 hypothetical protein [Argonema galeatum A003/A1]